MRVAPEPTSTSITFDEHTALSCSTTWVVLPTHPVVHGETRRESLSSADRWKTRRYGTQSIRRSSTCIRAPDE